MLNIFASIIKFYFIYFFCFYICYKSMELNLSKHFKFIICIFSLLLSIITYCLETKIAETKYILPVLLIWIIISIYNQKPQQTFILTLLSFILSCILYGFSSMILSLSIFIFFNGYFRLPYILLALVSGILHAFFIFSLFKITRFKKGLKFLCNKTFNNLATIICIFFFCIATYIHSYNLFDIGLIIAIFLPAFLIYWWQAQITKSYRRSLELRELESLKTEVAEQNLLIQRLKEDNERMARITHRDNTLITTLKNSTCRYLATDFDSVEEATAVRDELIANINALSEGRTSLPADYNEKKARDFDTNISLLSKLLHHMDEVAIEENINFSVHLGTELKNFVPNDISEDDLVHTIDDLLKNAFKSTMTCENRIVQLQFYKLGKHFVVEVSDNGIPFEVESLVNLGIEKKTTYVDGSGIGLMDIWETKEKYRATYHIDEHNIPEPFSKKISLTFDKKNRYSIRTWRKDEILQMSKRMDLQVYGHDE